MAPAGVVCLERNWDSWYERTTVPAGRGEPTALSKGASVGANRLSSSGSYDHQMGTYELRTLTGAPIIGALGVLSLLVVNGCGVGEQAPEAASETVNAAGAATADREVGNPSEPTAELLGLQLDPASVLHAGEGDSGTLNTIGWPDTALQPGDYTVHVQCVGADGLTFAYTSETRQEGMSHLDCGEPKSFDISVPELGYHVTLSGDPATTSNVEYVFAVTHQAS